MGRGHVWAEDTCGQRTRVGRGHVWAEDTCGQSVEVSG